MGSADTSDDDVTQLFRQAMRLHVAGVCVITAGRGEAVNGMVATAVTSFSLDPPSILVCINYNASIAEQIMADRRFGVTLLGAHHADAANSMSRQQSGRERFDCGGWRFSTNAPPVLDDASANLVCATVASLGFATHHALVGKIEAVTVQPAVPTLLYGNGTYLSAARNA